MFIERIKNIIDFFDNRGLDSLFLACVTSLIIIGLVMVTSSTVDFAAAKFSNPLFFFKKQLIFIILGLVILYIVTHIKTNFYYDYGQYFLLLSLIISLLVHIPGLGVTINGATRWINLGFFTLQVSEVSRLFFFIWLSGYITRNDFNKDYLKIFIFLTILMLAIVLQRDFGSMILLFVAFIIFSFLSHVKLMHLLKIIFFAIIPILLLIIMYPYRIQRILAFINPWNDPQGSGYQIIASQIALSSGGYFGQGLGSSMQKLFYLPEQYNDFILAIIGEELGFIFLIFILLLYVIIFWRIFIFYNITCNISRFSSNLVLGIILLILIQTVIHVLVNIGLFPTKGMGLPFISYGGTNLLLMFTYIGILIRIQIENKQSHSQAVHRSIK
ncbi:putative lipid II flippase FtsW [Gammaproteobacteria bacterium]|nr:putative lipid II flippase FtsW [Gammaproteobacteria bacterium]